MKSRYIIYGMMAVLLGGGLSSCTKEFEDMNRPYNAPSNASVQILKQQNN